MFTRNYSKIPTVTHNRKEKFILMCETEWKKKSSESRGVFTIEMSRLRLNLMHTKCQGIQIFSSFICDTKRLYRSTKIFLKWREGPSSLSYPPIPPLRLWWRHIQSCRRKPLIISRRWHPLKFSSESSHFACLIFYAKCASASSEINIYMSPIMLCEQGNSSFVPNTVTTHTMFHHCIFASACRPCPTRN